MGTPRPPEPAGAEPSAPTDTTPNEACAAGRADGTGARVDIANIERVRLILLEQAELFDDSSAYAAGVEDALDALMDLRTGGAEEDAPLTAAGGWFG